MAVSACVLVQSRDAPLVAVLYREPEASRSEECIDEASRGERYTRLGLHLSSL